MKGRIVDIENSAKKLRKSEEIAIRLQEQHKVDAETIDNISAEVCPCVSGTVVDQNSNNIVTEALEVQ